MRRLTTRHNFTKLKTVSPLIHNHCAFLRRIPSREFATNVHTTKHTTNNNGNNTFKEHISVPVESLSLIDPSFDLENYSWSTSVPRRDKNNTQKSREAVFEQRRVGRMFDRMSRRIEFKRRCSVMNFEMTWFSFTSYVLNGNFPELYHTMLEYVKANTTETKFSLSYTENEALEDFILPYFNSYCARVHPEDYRSFQEGLALCDFTNPQLYFLRKKKLKRRIIYHSGPTNSGKTYQALLRLSQAQTGVYLAPLRLLAQEICHRMNTQFQTPCSLLTGQEKREVLGANHIACTVEMVKTDQVYHVAVIDEIQMIKDAQRGRAWTQALLGLQAQEIHLCGDHTAIDLVQRILKNNGDESIEIVNYERMTELHLDPSGSLQGEVKNIQKRDCVIVFSRKDIFQMKNFIEVNTGLKCAVIYGGLPPDSRKEQADLFNDESTGYDVLVATDAVGMGLNLNIRRIVFYTVKKNEVANGMLRVKPVEFMLMKQISGRAGRRGFYDVGYVTTFYQKDFAYLQQSFSYALQPIESAGIFPDIYQLEEFADKFPDHSSDIAAVLEKYTILSRVHRDFFLCDAEVSLDIARRIRNLNLTLSQQNTFINAPTPKNEEAIQQLVNYATQFADPSVAVIAIQIDTRKVLRDLEAVHAGNNQRESVSKPGQTTVKDRAVQAALSKVEFVMKLLDMYRWLALRYPVRFNLDQVTKVQEDLVSQISKTLILNTKENQKHRTLLTLPKSEQQGFQEEEDDQPASDEGITNVFDALMADLAQATKRSK